jgi:hypothetical protein
MNLASDPTDQSDDMGSVDGEKLSLLFEPWVAPNWPADPNTPLPITDYSGVVSSYTDDFEIRIYRVFFFSPTDVTLAVDAVNNPLILDCALSFAFASFPGTSVQSSFTFDLTQFDPPLQIKSSGFILTHWLKYAEPPPCPGDLNGDGVVDDSDFQIFVPQYNILDCSDPSMPDNCSADLNGDGVVDDGDFQIFVVAYNALLCPSPSVVRNAYAPFAGGRFQWNTPDNLPADEFISPPAFAMPVVNQPTPAWPFPNDLVTAPSPSGNCLSQDCLPSFACALTTYAGCGQLAASPLDENVPYDQIPTEYTNWANAVLSNPDAYLQTWFFDPTTSMSGVVDLATQWLPSSTPKRFSVQPPSQPPN